MLELISNNEWRSACLMFCGKGPWSRAVCHLGSPDQLGVVIGIPLKNVASEKEEKKTDRASHDINYVEAGCFSVMLESFQSEKHMVSVHGGHGIRI